MIEAIRISKESFGELRKKFDSFTQTEKKERIPASESYCHTKILVGISQGTTKPQITTKCFDHFSQQKKTAVRDFLKKSNQSFD